jgi:hypothetical protein
VAQVVQHKSPAQVVAAQIAAAHVAGTSRCGTSHAAAQVASAQVMLRHKSLAQVAAAQVMRHKLLRHKLLRHKSCCGTSHVVVMLLVLRYINHTSHIEVWCGLLGQILGGVIIWPLGSKAKLFERPRPDINKLLHTFYILVWCGLLCQIIQQAPKRPYSKTNLTYSIQGRAGRGSPRVTGATGLRGSGRGSFPLLLFLGRWRLHLGNQRTSIEMAGEARMETEPSTNANTSHNHMSYICNLMIQIR